MAINKYKDHVVILPEDDANRQLANGFILETKSVVDVRPVSGGWLKVVEDFEKNHISELEKYGCRHFVMLVDFDGDYHNRIQYINNKIPATIRDRVYVIGVSQEPENLKQLLKKSLEDIGSELADDCRNNSVGNWGSELLKHNSLELKRLETNVKPFLFI